jgi:hypothetical protein
MGCGARGVGHKGDSRGARRCGAGPTAQWEQGQHLGSILRSAHVFQHAHSTRSDGPRGAHLVILEVQLGHGLLQHDGLQVCVSGVHLGQRMPMNTARGHLPFTDRDKRGRILPVCCQSVGVVRTAAQRGHCAVEGRLRGLPFLASAPGMLPPVACSGGRHPPPPSPPPHTHTPTHLNTQAAVQNNRVFVALPSRGPQLPLLNGKVGDTSDVGRHRLQHSIRHTVLR